MKITYNDFLKINEKKSINISLIDIEKILLNIFNDSVVSSVNTLYEKDKKGGYLLIVTINNIFYNKTDILHTKLIFNVDKDKTKITDNYLFYLYDLNCNFKRIDFNDIFELENKLKEVLNKRIIGKDLKKLSDLNITLTIDTNKLLEEKDMNNISIYSITYSPIVNHIPCESLFFKFEINIKDIKTIDMNIRKIDKNDFKITFQNNDDFTEFNISDLSYLSNTICEMLKKYNF
jgi:hypothetical protein